MICAGSRLCRERTEADRTCRDGRQPPSHLQYPDLDTYDHRCQRPTRERSAARARGGFGSLVRLRGPLRVDQRAWSASCGTSRGTRRSAATRSGRRPISAIYLGGVVAGLTCGWMALRLTFAGTAASAARARALLGLPRAARRVGLHLGRVRDADLGAVRRLVAQHLRPRRQDSEPAARACSPPASAPSRSARCSWRWPGRTARAATRPRACRRCSSTAPGLLLLDASRSLSTEYIAAVGHAPVAVLPGVARGVFPFFLVSAARASTARWPATHGRCGLHRRSRCS